MSHVQQNYAQRIREQGFRLTPQRQHILDALCEAGGHATATEVYERVQLISPAINRATVYRALSFFCDLRLVVSSEIGGKVVYEIADPTPHHHLVCRCCGGVEPLGDHHFQELAKHLSAEHGFEAEMDHLTISGVCAQCHQGG